MPGNARPLNFALLRDLVTPEQVLRRAGWRPVATYRMQLRGPCPLHHSEDPRSKTLAVGRRVVYCHKCRRFADALGLWASLKRLDLLAAAYDLCVEFGINPPYLH